MRRASDWQLRVMHEAQMHDETCFVTLTYGQGCMPPNGSLEHGDFQKFMKRLRARKVEKEIRYYMCGEYGDEKGRPHYHACLFGINFWDREPIGKSASGAQMYNSAELREIWGHGNVTVQDLVRETAGYCARYIMKKQLGTNENGVDAKNAYNIIGANGEVYERQPPYANMSLKPGIGIMWFEKFWKDVFPHDYVVSEGSKKQVPRYYDKLLKKLSDDVLKDVQSARVERAGDYTENTEQRRIAKEIVHEAKLANLRRTL